MKRRMVVLALMVAVATMMLPISGSAAPFTDLTAWQTAVGSYANVTLPSSDLTAYQSLALPSGGGDFFNINTALTYTGGFYYTPAANTTANLAFYPGGVSGPISAFGFEVVPLEVGSTLSIYVYTAAAGDHTYNFTATNTAPMFFGWVGADVITVSTSSSARYGLGNFVEGVTSVPEPSTLLLLGSGLLGLVGYGRRRMRK
jgi:hypothetical protein